MRLTTLLPHLVGLRVHDEVAVSATDVVLTAEPTTRSGCCPACGRRSHSIHSRYARRVTDQPIGGRQVTIHLWVWRFRCRAAACTRRTFTEQVPRLVARYARRSVPLQEALGDIGLTLGGRPGARFAVRRAVPVSRSTLLRLVRLLPLPDPGAPVVLGIDDFALRRGHRYGTVVVDLQAHRVVDLLPDRTAATVVAWMSGREPPECVCRDRGGAYADAARRAAPDATQIADRFHLSCNGSTVLERVLARHPAALRRAGTAPDAGAAPAPASTVAAPLTERAPADPGPPSDPRRERRRARYDEVLTRHRAGETITAIGAGVGLCRQTVRKYVEADACPSVPSRRTLLRTGSPHEAYLRVRWGQGCRDAHLLHQELQARGFTGPLRMVQRAVADWREDPGRRGRCAATAQEPAPPPPAHPLSPRQATWLLLRPIGALTDEERTLRTRVLAGTPALGAALAAVEAFRALVRTQERAALDPWLEAATTSTVAAIRTFAAGVRRDYKAIAAALEYSWSSGQVEGQVTKIKLRKREMYGRGNFDLLRRRVLLGS